MTSFSQKFSHLLCATCLCFSLTITSAHAFQSGSSGGSYNQTAKAASTRGSRDKSLDIVNLINRNNSYARDFYRSAFAQVMGLVFFDPNTPDIGSCQREVLNYHLPELTKKNLNLDTLKEEVARAYAETYTEDEIAWMQQFYATPFGERMLKKQFQLNDKIARLIAERYGNLKPEFTKVYTTVNERCGASKRGAISLPTDSPELGNDLLSLPHAPSSAPDPLSPTRATP